MEKKNETRRLIVVRDGSGAVIATGQELEVIGKDADVSVEIMVSEGSKEEVTQEVFRKEEHKLRRRVTKKP